MLFRSTDVVKHAVKVDLLIAQLVATPLPQILPESFYSSIESTVGVSLHHHIWAPLGKTGVRDGNFNINHEIIARVAATTQATIITPNYDSFIEAALESWQVPYEVIHNNQLNKLIDPAPSNSVRLIKIHGDAQRVETIVSREADLLRLFDALEPLSGTFDSALVAGYSGRDLDIFPWLASRAELKRILWIEPFLNSSHRGLRISDPTRPISSKIGRASCRERV